MKIRKKKLYEYDIKSGHYIRINEDEQQNGNVQTDANSQEQAKQATIQQAQTAVKTQEQIDAEKKASTLDSVDKQKAIEAFREKTKNIDSSYDRDITTQKELLAATENSVNTATDAAAKAKASNDALQIRKKIADIELKHSTDIANANIDHAKQLYRIECARLEVLQSAVNVAANESYKNLPLKYRGVLNESNIHQAKIYMTNIVVNDDEHILKDMRDFKRAFSESELVYGKDKKGFYVICIDQDDFNKLYATLENEGYRRDEIFANVMPQVLDRSSMISIDSVK